MSKFLTKISCLCFGLLLLMSQLSFAKEVVMDLDIDGKVTQYKAEEVFIKVDGTEVITKEMPPIIINERTLVPAREMFETMGAEVVWDNDLREVEVTFSDSSCHLKIGSEIAKVTKGEQVTEVTMDIVAKIINSKTMIPFRAVSEALGYNVEWVQDTRTIEITSPNASIVSEDVYELIPEDDAPEAIEKNALEWDFESKSIIEESNVTKENHDVCNVTSALSSFKDNYAQVTIKCDGKYSEVIPSVLDNRIVLDLTKTKRTIDEKIEFSDNEFVTALRSSQYEDETVRCVIDLKSTYMPYSLSFNKQRNELVVKIYKNEILNVNYNESSKSATFIIKTAARIDGKFIRLTDPDRLYIDLDNTKSYIGTKNTTLTDTKFVKAIRTSYEDNKTRFTLDLHDQYDFEMSKIDDNTLKLVIKKSDINELIKYSNTDGRTITLPVDLINNNSSSDIEVIEDYMNGIYEIKFGKNYSKLYQGKLQINDTMLDSFEFIKDGSKSAIKFNPRDNRIIALEVNKNRSDLVIKIMLPGEKYDEVLILDAGHGKGNEGTSDKHYTGYSSDKINTYYEDDMNMAIVESCYDYLEENSSMKVYLTRESNTKFNNYITTYPEENLSTRLLSGRAGMKNLLDADAFLSVHINAMGDPKHGVWETKVQGTEIWFNDTIIQDEDDYNGLTNEKFAREVIDGFVDYNDGNYENNDGKESKYLETSSGLAVLKRGAMPSALIEIGYINNEIDHENLLNPEYLKKSGESLAKTLIDIFKKYKLNKN